MPYSIAFHLVGIVMWLGGLMILTRIAKMFAAQQEGMKIAGKIIKRSWFGFVIPGLCIATITGLYQLLQVGIGVYLSQGWFHGKMGALICLFVLTYYTHLEMSKFWNGTLSNGKRLGLLHGLSGLMLLLIVSITIVGR